MTENTRNSDPQMEALRTALQGMRTVAREMKDKMGDGRALAATPEGRQRIVETRAYLAEWRTLLAATVRELAEADRLLDKTLKKRWGIRV